MNLNSEYWSLGLCCKVGFMLPSRHELQFHMHFLVLFGLSWKKSETSFLNLSLNLSGFFPRCICFSLPGRAWMVGDAISSIWQGRTSDSLLKEAMYQKLSSNPCMFSVIAVGLDDFQFRLWFRGLWGALYSVEGDSFLPQRIVFWVLYSEWIRFFGTRC